MPKTFQQQKRDLRKARKQIISLRSKIFNYSQNRKIRISPFDAANLAEARYARMLERNASMRAIGKPFPRTIAEQKRFIKKICEDDIARFVKLYTQTCVKEGAGSKPSEIVRNLDRYSELSGVIERLMDWHEEAERFGITKVKYKSNIISLDVGFNSFLARLKNISAGPWKFEIKGEMKRP